MEEKYANDILDDFATKEQKPPRRALLPWWIKTFSWIFMILGAFAFAAFLLGFLGIKMQLSLYGLSTEDPQSALGFLLTGLFVLNGITGFALWAEKDWAINIGLVAAVLGTALCAALTLYSPWDNTRNGVNIRLELVLLIPFLLKLRSMQHEWINREETT
jgi:hypothetical protein